MITELNDEQTRELLRNGRIARLGCCTDGEPYIVPVSYLYDGEFMLVHSLPGRKITMMRENPRVCLQVDEITDDFDWRSVLVFGRYEEITDRSECSRIISLLLTRYPRLTPVETFILEDSTAPAPIIFRIRIERLTGICEGKR